MTSTSALATFYPRAGTRGNSELASQRIDGKGSFLPLTPGALGSAMRDEHRTSQVALSLSTGFMFRTGKESIP